MARKVEIGGRVFPTKESVLAEIRAIRDRYPDGVVLEYSDHTLLRDLVSLRSEAEEKIGIGISHFTVTTETEFGGRNRHFVLHRHDNSFTDFSFVHCLNPKSKSKNDRILALRQAIKEQTWAFRDGSFRLGNRLSAHLSMSF